MGDDHEVCNSTLGLAISLDDFVPKSDQQQKSSSTKPVICFDLSFHFKDDHEEMETKGFERNGDQEETQITSNGGVRKKLRLTKEQSRVLEDSFKQHTSLNMADKKALAEKLNLKPRQVEVWFQNRRARTKLKQTEVDCEFLKKCCENLSDQNRKLKKEVQELRSSFKNRDKATTAPFFVQLQKTGATISMCSSCEKMARSKGNCCGGDVVKHER